MSSSMRMLLANLTSRLIRYLNLNPDITPESGKWILGFGWDQTLWPGSEFPTASDLDSNPRLAAIPISLVRIDGHALWCNSLALQLSKASIPPADVPTPGGQVIRFPSNSAPTGVFLDDAMSFIQSNIPPPSYEQRVQAVETASRLMLEKGLTGLHDAGVSLDDISLFKSLIEQNKFPIRSYAMILCSPLSICTDTPLPPPYTTSKSGLLTVRAVKLVSDGALGSWGASLHSPYSDSPSKSGIQKISQEDLQKALTTTITQGYQPAIHAIGDRANAIALDTLESLHLHLHLHLHLTPPTTATPPNLTSILLTPQDIPRFKSLGVIPSLQPTHTTSDMGFAVSRLGLHRAKTGAYRVRSLWPAPFGSDFPIEGVDPMRGIYSATTRKWENGSSPDGEGVGWIDEERVSRREALDGFTKWAAWARFGEKEMGRVAVGMWADYVVYEEDWVKEEEEGGGIGEQDLLKVVPLATVVGGVVRFGKLM
ncbi:amidohydrolase 3 [Rhizoclosmatium globosum]|uniref:Amidohydrolase 3 n=1 Tax=Rhizoclosmatium globosum TaxID=329046 RepID=A0A1Y2BMY6_9FUNG|nr:amidohydrolase 3 [Rhizoclosmatium globosum]|eukprot:ORY36124.1 amidohydrolase 3 [Rhizoclosmatium globosum]